MFSWCGLFALGNQFGLPKAQQQRDFPSVLQSRQSFSSVPPRNAILLLRWGLMKSFVLVDWVFMMAALDGVSLRLNFISWQEFFPSSRHSSYLFVPILHLVLGHRYRLSMRVGGISTAPYLFGLSPIILICFMAARYSRNVKPFTTSHEPLSQQLLTIINNSAQFCALLFITALNAGNHKILKVGKDN